MKHTLYLMGGVVVEIVSYPRPRKPHGAMVYIADPLHKYRSAAWFATGRQAIRATIRSYRWSMMWAKGLAALKTVATIREQVAQGYLPDSILDTRSAT